MADVNYTITIEVKGDVAENKENKAVADTQNGDKAQESPFNSKKLLKAATVGIGIRSAKAIISHQIGMTELRTGHSTYQQKLQFVYNTSMQSNRYWYRRTRTPGNGWGYYPSADP